MWCYKRITSSRGWGHLPRRFKGIMNYIDLFSGIGGFHQGLLQAGFIFEKSYHSEIDKYAKSVYQRHFPESEDLGDVTTIDVSGFSRGKYIVTAGWPCQDNSIAGKRKGQSGGLRSGLFDQVIRILSGLVSMGSEVIFIGENVKGLYSVNDRVDFYDTITGLTYLDTDMPQLTLESQLCNTRWFLPRIESGFTLSDILEKEVDKKYFLSQKAMKFLQQEEKRTGQGGSRAGKLLMPYEDAEK